MATEKHELLVRKASEFTPLSNEGVSNVTMLGIYISMVIILEDNLEKVMQSIRIIIAKDKCNDLPILSLTIELLQSFNGIWLLNTATLLA